MFAYDVIIICEVWIHDTSSMLLSAFSSTSIIFNTISWFERLGFPVLPGRQSSLQNSRRTSNLVSSGSNASTPGFVILLVTWSLMAEIMHYLGCIKPCKWTPKLLFFFHGFFRINSMIKMIVIYFRWTQEKICNSWFKFCNSCFGDRNLKPPRSWRWKVSKSRQTFECFFDGWTQHVSLAHSAGIRKSRRTYL